MAQPHTERQTAQHTLLVLGSLIGQEKLFRLERVLASCPYALHRNNSRGGSTRAGAGVLGCCWYGSATVFRLVWTGRGSHRREPRSHGGICRESFQNQLEYGWSSEKLWANSHRATRRCQSFRRSTHPLAVWTVVSDDDFPASQGSQFSTIVAGDADGGGSGNRPA